MSHHLQLREELELGSEVVLDTVTRTSQETEPRVRARVTRCAILWIERETAPSLFDIKRNGRVFRF